MAKNVLLGTLGESPAVITEALDALKNRGVSIDKVILLTTIDSAAEASLNLLIAHIPTYYRIKDVDFFQIGAYTDINTEEAVIKFMGTACDQLRSLRKRICNVYVSIAGGRKTMSALMTLAVQIYGAKELFHIIVEDKELEERGKIDRLRHFTAGEQDEILHPDIGKIKVINMPFIGLFPWISDILKTLRGERTEKKEIRELLHSNNLVEDDKPTKLGKQFLEILERVESVPEPCPETPRIKLSSSEPRYKKEIENQAQKLLRFSFVCEIADGEWRKGEPKVKIEHPDKLRLYFQSGKGFNFCLILKTSAKTHGQLELCKMEVDNFLDRIK